MENRLYIDAEGVHESDTFQGHCTTYNIRNIIGTKGQFRASLRGVMPPLAAPGAVS